MRRRSITVLVTVAAMASGCGPAWPNEHFPPEIAVARTLSASNDGFFMEGCTAIVVELTDGPQPQLSEAWRPTPVVNDPSARPSYEHAFAGCGDSKTGPPVDLPSALTRPGAYYKVINGGEGIAIMLPTARLAGFFYFG